MFVFLKSSNIEGNAGRIMRYIFNISGIYLIRSRLYSYNQGYRKTDNIIR